MRVLVYGDTHVQANAPYSLPVEDGLTTHLVEILSWFQWLQGEVIKYRPDAVIDLGDLFSSYGSIDVRALNVGVEGTNAVQTAVDEVGANYYFVIGNHDLYQGILHNVPFFPGVAFQRPRVLYIDDVKVGFVPYGHNVADVAAENPLIVFTHNDYVAVPYVTGRLPEKGDTLEGFTGKRVYNGHYHVPGYHDFGNLRVVNAGSVGARTFRDCGVRDGGVPARHGAWLIESSGGNVTETFLENPYTSYWLHLDGNDPDKIEEIVQSGLATRINLRVERPSNVNIMTPNETLESFKHADVVTLPPIHVRHSADTKPETDDTIHIDPLGAVHTYLKTQHTEKLIPESISYESLYKFVQELVTKIIAQEKGRAVSMPLHFSRVELSNFMSLGDVSFDLRPGVSAVIGANRDAPVREANRFENNGSGKTATVEGIYWILTGQTIRGSKGTHIIRTGEKEAVGTLIVEAGERRYRLERSIRKSGRSTPQVLMVSVWDHEVDKFVDITPRLQEGAHTVISDLLSLDDDLLMHLVFLMAGLTTSMTRLKPLDRFRLLERLVGDLSLFDTCAREVQTTLTQVTNEHSGRQGEQREIEGGIGRYDNELEAKQTELAQIEANTESERRRLCGRKEELATQQVALEAEIERVRSLYAQTETERQKHDDERVGLGGQLNTHGQNQASLHEQVMAVKSQMATQEALVEAGLCPTCGAATQTPERASSLDELKADLTVKEEAKSAVEFKLMDVRKKMAVIEEHASATTNEARMHNASIQTNQQSLSTIGSELTNIDGQIDHLDQQVGAVRQRIEFITSELESLKGRRLQVETEIETLEHTVSMLRYLYNAPAKSGVFSANGVRAQVVQSVLNFINARCAIYSQYLLMPGQTIKMTGTSATKAGKVSSKIDLKLEGSKRPYASLSAGEARRVDLALHFALRDLAQASSKFQSNLLILDEVLDPLDDAGLRDILRLLDTFSGLSTWVVTQNDRLRGELDSGILVVKQGGVSTAHPMEG